MYEVILGLNINQIIKIIKNNLIKNNSFVAFHLNVKTNRFIMFIGI